MKNNMGHWTYPKKFNPHEYFGFIYIITNMTNGKRYLGRKFFFQHKKGKRIRESDWRTYMGSSRGLSKDIKELGKENFKFEIFNLYTTRGGLCYFETYYLCKFNVLTERTPEGERTWYNNSIGAVKWIPKEEHTEETKYKISQSLQGNQNAKGSKRTRAQRKHMSRRNSGLNHPQADRNIYTFIHKDGRRVICTRVELCKLYGVSITHLTKVMKGKLKSTGGWSLKDG